MHVGDPGPGLGGRVEDVGVDEALVARCRHAEAADGHDPPVGQLHVAGAEDARRRVDGREGLAAGS